MSSDSAETFIVKVQLSAVTDGLPRQVSVYTKTRSIFMQGNAPEAVVEKMGDKQNAFFEASCGERCLQLVREVDDQGW